MSQVVVHIGTHKTGSTSIQSFLDGNHETLASAGFAVPAMWGTNHQPLALLAYDPERWDEVCAIRAAMDGLGHDRIDALRWAAYLDDLREQFTAWARRESHQTLVLSSETLYSHLFDKDITRLADVLHSVSDDVTVVLYVREPLSFRLSLFLTEIILGRHFDPLELEPPVDPGWERLADWEAAFPGRVRVRLFDPADFVNGDLLQDFCAAAGIPWRDDFMIPPRQNESMSWSTAKVLNAANAALPLTLADGSLNPARGNLWLYLLASDHGSLHYRPSAEAIETYRHHYAETNEWLRQQFFPDRDHLWTTPVRPRDDGTDHLYGPELTEAEHSFADFIIRSAPGLAEYSNAVAARDRAQAQLQMVMGSRVWRSTAWLRARSRISRAT